MYICKKRRKLLEVRRLLGLMSTSARRIQQSQARGSTSPCPACLLMAI